jgi:hypothetical protein
MSTHEQPLYTHDQLGARRSPDAVIGNPIEQSWHEHVHVFASAQNIQYTLPYEHVLQNFVSSVPLVSMYTMQCVRLIGINALCHGCCTTW